MKKSLKFLIFGICISLLIFPVLIHDFWIRPFINYDNFTLNYEENNRIKYKDSLKDFFINYVNLNQYVENHKVTFFSCFGKESWFGFLTNYAEESFSITINYSKDSYNIEKEKLLNEITFLSIPIGNSNEIKYIDYIKIDDNYFMEIDTGEPIYYTYQIREILHLFSYNDNLKQIRFSLIIDLSLDYYSNESFLEKYIKTNLF